MRVDIIGNQVPEPGDLVEIAAGPAVCRCKRWWVLRLTGDQVCAGCFVREDLVPMRRVKRTSNPDGRISLVDLHVSADAACREINRWVEDKTRQRIQNLIPPGSLNSDTRLVLVNAVYFKGTWVLKFEERYTSKEP